MRETSFLKLNNKQVCHTFHKNRFLKRSCMIDFSLSLKTRATISSRSQAFFSSNRTSLISVHFGLHVILINKSGFRKFLRVVQHRLSSQGF
jgi:hypothetical protein